MEDRAESLALRCLLKLRQSAFQRRVGDRALAHFRLARIYKREYCQVKSWPAEVGTGWDTLVFDDPHLWGLPLHKAAETGQMTVVLLLLDAGVDINARDSLGMTALHYAATPVSLSDAGGPEMIHVLVERGANLEARNGSGQKPLEYAQARSGYGEFAEIAQILQAQAAR